MATIGCDRDDGHGENNNNDEDVEFDNGKGDNDRDGDGYGDGDGDGDGDVDGDSGGGGMCCSPTDLSVGRISLRQCRHFQHKPKHISTELVQFGPTPIRLSLRRSRHRSFGSNTGHPAGRNWHVSSSRGTIKSLASQSSNRGIQHR